MNSLKILMTIITLVLISGCYADPIETEKTPPIHCNYDFKEDSHSSRKFWDWSEANGFCQFKGDCKCYEDNEEIVYIHIKEEN